MSGMNQNLAYAARKALARQNQSIKGIDALILDPVLNAMATSTGVTVTGVHHTIPTNTVRDVFGTRLAIGSGSIYMYTLEGIGASEDKTEVVAFEYRGQVKNVDGTITLIDTPFKLLEQKDSNITVEITVDSTSLKLIITNESGKTYNVSSFIRFIKVG